MSSGLDLRSVAAALAVVVGVEQVPVPSAGSDPMALWREWLAVRNLGLVPIRAPPASAGPASSSP